MLQEAPQGERERHAREKEEDRQFDSGGKLWH